MNKIFLVGNLVRDPELRTTQGGINVCTFTIAVNKRQKGEANAADYFRVTAWRQLGENCQKFLAKGRRVCVVGEVSVSTYTTQNGETRANMEVTAQDVEFLTPRSEQTETPPQSANTAHQEASNGYTEVGDDDFPWLD
jgi:single-strand DNA-binding protein